MQAIILKKIPIREFDELIICYTHDEGKAIYVAKSTRKTKSKQVSHLDIFNLVDFNLVQKYSMPIITSSYSLNNFAHLKAFLPVVTSASYLLEVFDKFIFEGDSDPRLWDFLVTKLNYFDDLAKNNVRIDWPKTLIETKKEVAQVLGFDSNTDLEDLVKSRFNSLEFAQKVFSRI
jgi:DNA repair protein RecO